jgi:arginase family enzyme
MPHFNDVYNEVKDDVVFIMVDLVDGNRETVETGKSFIRENGYDFPVYFDITQNAANIYRVSSIPQTVFINAEGNIEAVYAYPIPKSTLLSAIEKIK